MYGIRDGPPTFDLRLRIDAGRILIALTLLRDLRGLGDDEPCRGPLRVIGRRMRARNQPRRRAVARQRRHDDTVGKRDVTQLVGRKKRGLCHVRLSVVVKICVCRVV